MSPVRRSRQLLLPVVLLFSCTAVAFAADPLPGASPFLPPASQGSAGATPNAQLELRGIMAEGDTVMFSIYDTAHHTSAWTRLNEPGHDFTVRSYDANRDTVTVDYQGRTLTLALHTAKVVSAPVSFPQVIRPGFQPVLQPIGGPVVLNPTPADEQRRLEAIAAEVNRRRLIRQQALQASREAAGQNGPPVRPPNQSR